MSELSTFIGGASGAKPWVSGAVIKQYAYVISPLDGEIYQRKTATGSGTTDPADDLTNYFAASYVRSGTRDAVANVDVTASAPGITGPTRVLLAAITSGVRTKILGVTGRGSCAFLGFQPNTNAANGLLEVVVDGRTIYTATTAYGPGTSGRLTAVPLGSLVPSGAAANFVASPDFAPVFFRRTLDVYFTPTVTTFANNTLWHSLRGES